MYMQRYRVTTTLAMCTCVTFVSSSRLSKTARDKISSQTQRPVRSSVDIFDQHIDARVLPFGGQLQQLIESLQEIRGLKFTR